MNVCEHTFDLVFFLTELRAQFILMSFTWDQTRATLLHLETLGVPTACEDRSVKETEISRS